MADHIYYYSMPLLFKKILNDSLSGELKVKDKKLCRTLYFVEGELMFAESNRGSERLGEILFSTGKIDCEEFSVIDKMDGDSKLGQKLVQKKVVTARDIFLALLYKVRMNGVSTFLMNTGEWEFVAKTPGIPSNYKFPIELPGIICEGTKRLDDFGYFKKELAKLSPRISAIPQTINSYLTEDEIRFYIKLDRYKDKINLTVITALEMDEEQYWKYVVLYFLLNVLEFVEIEIKEDIHEANKEAILQLYEGLKTKRLDYYQLLGTSKSATQEEIKAAYFKASQKLHPDRVPEEQGPELKKKAEFVLCELNSAYGILSDKEKRNDYERGGYKEGAEAGVSRFNAIREAKKLYLKAKNLFAAEKYWEASRLLEDAVLLDGSKANYYYKLGLCQAKVTALKKLAENNLQKAAKMEPWNAEPVYALGVLYRAENLRKLSEKYFRKALEINIEHTKAGRMVKHIESETARKKDLFSFFGSKKSR